MILNKNLFLVDDDEDDRLFFVEAVAQIDNTINVSTAFDGIKALDLLEVISTRPDLIFMDINMPRMDGMQCLHILKKHSVFKTIPVLMLTTSGDHREKCSALGAHATLIKPMSINIFTQMLTEILQTDFSAPKKLKFSFDKPFKDGR